MLTISCAACRCKRNIVPLMLEGFDFNTPAVANQLTGTLAVLKGYNALPVSPEYVDASMERLCTQFLNVPLHAVRHPLSVSAQETATAQEREAGMTSVFLEEELAAKQWFAQVGPIAAAAALLSRGSERHAKGDLKKAIYDYTESIRLNPTAAAFLKRGQVRQTLGELEKALQDYNEASRLV